MSDDNSKNQPSEEQDQRHSPVIERDVAADPSQSGAPKPLPKISFGLKPTPSADAPSHKERAPESNSEPQGVDEDIEEEEDDELTFPAFKAAEESDADEAPAEGSANEADIGMFLEEIFSPSPTHTMPGPPATAEDEDEPPARHDEGTIEDEAAEAVNPAPEEDPSEEYELLPIDEEPAVLPEEREPMAELIEEDPEESPLAIEEIGQETPGEVHLDMSSGEEITPPQEDGPPVHVVVDDPEPTLLGDEFDEQLEAQAAEEEEEEPEVEEPAEAPLQPTPEEHMAPTTPPSEEIVEEPASELEPESKEEAETYSFSPVLEAPVEAPVEEAIEEPAQGTPPAPPKPLYTPLDTSELPIDEDGVRDLLEQVGTIAAECGMHSLSNEITQERLPSLSRGRITLVVLGEFNHGKSTVINALLGDDVLPMGITPTTAVITHLVHAEEPVVTIQPPNHGKPYTIAYEGMEAAVRESGDEGEEPEYVEIGYPNEVLKNSLVLVDTPGVNDISRQKVEITYGYLPRADVILYVLDATQVLKKSEVTFIRDRLLKSSSDRIIFVLNKIDALSPDDIEEVVQYARERLEQLLGPVELFTFSGRKALQAQQKGSDLPAEFQKFQSYLQSFLQEQRAYIILDAALSGGLRVSGLLQQNLAIKRHGYGLERDELERRIQAVRGRLKESRRLIAENTQLIDTRVAGIAATAKHNLRVFSEQFSEQLPMQIERADAGDVKKFLPSWIQETFKEWLEAEGSALARSLEELAEEIIQITNESLQDAVQTYQDEFGLSSELDLSVDTVAYDVSVFALGAFGVSIFLFANVLVGSLLTLATPMLAYFFKEKIETKIKERAREQGAQALTATSQKLEEELLRVIHDYGDRLKSFVETAGDRLYRQIEEALEQVQQDTRGEYDRDALLAETAARLTRVKALHAELSAARQDLAQWAATQGF